MHWKSYNDHVEDELDYHRPNRNPTCWNIKSRYLQLNLTLSKVVINNITQFYKTENVTCTMMQGLSCFHPKLYYYWVAHYVAQFMLFRARLSMCLKARLVLPSCVDKYLKVGNKLKLYVFQGCRKMVRHLLTLL